MGSRINRYNSSCLFMCKAFIAAFKDLDFLFETIRAAIVETIKMVL
jgi:hypothetical protein